MAMEYFIAELPPTFDQHGPAFKFFHALKVNVYFSPFVAFGEELDRLKTVEKKYNALLVEMAKERRERKRRRRVEPRQEKEQKPMKIKMELREEEEEEGQEFDSNCETTSEASGVGKEKEQNASISVLPGNPTGEKQMKKQQQNQPHTTSADCRDGTGTDSESRIASVSTTVVLSAPANEEQATVQLPISETIAGNPATIVTCQHCPFSRASSAHPSHFFHHSIHHVGREWGRRYRCHTCDYTTRKYLSALGHSNGGGHPLVDRAREDRQYLSECLRVFATCFPTVPIPSSLQ